MLNRQDFRAIAEAVFTCILLREQRLRVGNAIADHCAKSNPKFDRARFIRWCESGETKRVAETSNG